MPYLLLFYRLWFYVFLFYHQHQKIINQINKVQSNIFSTIHHFKLLCTKLNPHKIKYKNNESKFKSEVILRGREEKGPLLHKIKNVIFKTSG